MINSKHWVSFFIIEIFFISVAIFVVVNAVFMYWIDIHAFDLVKATGVNAQHIFSDYLRIIYYIQNPFSESLRFNYFDFTTNGLKHFRDVKHLIVFNELILMISGWFTWRYLKQVSLLKIRWQLLLPIKWLLAFLLVFLTMAFVNFQNVFIWFHDVAFRNQDWIFNPNSDPIILALPLEFFLQSFLLVMGIMLVFNFVIYGLGKKDLRCDK